MTNSIYVSCNPVAGSSSTAIALSGGSSAMVSDLITRMSDKRLRMVISYQDFDIIDSSYQVIGTIGYSIPLVLVPTVKSLLHQIPDFDTNMCMNPVVASSILGHPLFLMAYSSRKDLIEDFLLKWSGPIHDALQAGFKVSLIHEHLNKLAFLPSDVQNKCACMAEEKSRVSKPLVEMMKIRDFLRD